MDFALELRKLAELYASPCMTEYAAAMLRVPLLSKPVRSAGFWTPSLHSCREGHTTFLPVHRPLQSFFREPENLLYFCADDKIQVSLGFHVVVPGFQKLNLHE